jgi:hypothetical protein
MLFVMYCTSYVVHTIYVCVYRTLYIHTVGVRIVRSHCTVAMFLSRFQSRAMARFKPMYSTRYVGRNGIANISYSSCHKPDLQGIAATKQACCEL